MGADRLFRTWVACGLTDVVISPGSRNAPLVIAAAQFPEIRIITALDERSAAHMALGLALQTRRPAVVVSTSGTAAVNHGPALAEAYYQGVPLISVTADRPLASHATGPGQTVKQSHLFAMHTVHSAEINETEVGVPEIDEAARTAWQKAKIGPVHLNVPFDEPLYAQGEVEPLPALAASEEANAPAGMPEALLDFLCAHDAKVLLHVGAATFPQIPADVMERLVGRCGVIADRFGCIQSPAESSTARWMAGMNEEAAATFKPDVILTTGLPPMDKKFRSLLTEWQVPHWHVGLDQHAWDMFGTRSGTWQISAVEGLRELAEAMPEFNAYAANWEVRKLRLEQANAQLESKDWVDYRVYQKVAECLQSASGRIHFANSTSARYAQWFEWGGNVLHANRGVAGIDGCTSTAVGDALRNPDVPVFLMSGDAAWLYDANAWHVHPRPANLKVVVINNGGGNIFRWLDGPQATGLLKSHFEAGFAESVAGSAQQAGLRYFLASDEGSLETALKDWYNNDGPSLLEIKTPGEASAAYILNRIQLLGKHVG